MVTKEQPVLSPAFMSDVGFLCLTFLAKLLTLEENREETRLIFCVYFYRAGIQSVRNKRGGIKNTFIIFYLY